MPPVVIVLLFFLAYCIVGAVTAGLVRRFTDFITPTHEDVDAVMVAIFWPLALAVCIFYILVGLICATYNRVSGK